VRPGTLPRDRQERSAGTLRRECLDQVLILGERHLRKVRAGCARYYNGHPSAPGRAAGTPLRQPGHAVDITARIERSHVVGGLISEYRRAAEQARNARSPAISGFWHGTPFTADPARVGDPPQPVQAARSLDSAAPLKPLPEPVDLEPCPVRKARSRQRHAQRIPAGRMTWARFSPLTVPGMPGRRPFLRSASPRRDCTPGQPRAAYWLTLVLADTMKFRLGEQIPPAAPAK
jgi:hypothetical protein